MGETDRPARRPVLHRLSYVNVRGADGRLLFRYDPERSLVEIRVRGQTEVVDLTTYSDPAAEQPPNVISPPDPVEEADRRSGRSGIANR